MPLQINCPDELIRVLSRRFGSILEDKLETLIDILNFHTSELKDIRGQQDRINRKLNGLRKPTCEVSTQTEFDTIEVETQCSFDSTISVEAKELNIPVEPTPTQEYSNQIPDQKKYPNDNAGTKKTPLQKTFVLKGLPLHTSTEDLQANLANIGIDAKNLVRMTSTTRPKRQLKQFSFISLEDPPSLCGKKNLQGTPILIEEFQHNHQGTNKEQQAKWNIWKFTHRKTNTGIKQDLLLKLCSKLIQSL